MTNRHHVTLDCPACGEAEAAVGDLRAGTWICLANCRSTGTVQLQVEITDNQFDQGQGT